MKWRDGGQHTLHMSADEVTLAIVAMLALSTLALVFYCQVAKALAERNARANSSRNELKGAAVQVLNP